MKLTDDLITDTCSTSQNSFYFGMTLSFIILILILISIRNLEKSKCKCAEIPEKKFIKEWFTFSLIFQSVLILFFILSDDPCYIRFINNLSIYPIMFIFGIINIIMVIRLIIYLYKLRNNCPCGYGNIERFIFWYLVIILSIGAFLISLLLILFFATFFMFFQKS